MNKRWMLACVAWVAAAALVRGVPPPQEVPGNALKHTHEWNVVIVSIDAVNEVVTFKEEKGKTWTVPVATSILSKMKELKPGEIVNLTCEDDPNGVHESIVKFKPVRAHQK
jgi:hypothetical protein